MDRPLPEVRLVDMRQEFQETGEEKLFSRALIAGDAGHAGSRRAGHYPAQPPRLFVCGDLPRLRRKARLRELLHRADLSQAADRRRRPRHRGSGWNVTIAVTKRPCPSSAPQCDSEYLYFLGAGSQQGEERLQEIFPGARIGRMDRDTVRGRGDMERLLVRLHSGEINLLVGTQMIAKGHDIHGVTLVGVVGCDYALGLPDFRAAERVFQLLTQVSGRAGRGELPGPGARADVSHRPLCDSVARRSTTTRASWRRN